MKTQHIPYIKNQHSLDCNRSPGFGEKGNKTHFIDIDKVMFYKKHKPQLLTGRADNDNLIWGETDKTDMLTHRILFE